MQGVPADFGPTQAMFVATAPLRMGHPRFPLDYLVDAVVPGKAPADKDFLTREIVRSWTRGLLAMAVFGTAGFFIGRKVAQ